MPPQTSNSSRGHCRVSNRADLWGLCICSRSQEDAPDTGGTVTAEGAHSTKPVDVGGGWNSEGERLKRFAISVDGRIDPDPWNTRGGSKNTWRDG